MDDMAGWIWPLVAVAVGLALGIMLGAVRQRGRRTGGTPRDSTTPSALPAAGAGDAAARDPTPQQRLLERLRVTNLQLTSQLKSLTEANARQQQEREQERQSDRMRLERELEELRQAHSNELSHLMNTLVEQVDGLNKAHAEQLKVLEAEIERVRQEGRRGTTSSPGTLSGGPTRHGAIGGGAANPASAPATRSGATPSDYSVTLPMESFKDR